MSESGGLGKLSLGRLVAGAHGGGAHGWGAPAAATSARSGSDERAPSAARAGDSDGSAIGVSAWSLAGETAVDRTGHPPLARRRMYARPGSLLWRLLFAAAVSVLRCAAAAAPRSVIARPCIIPACCNVTGGTLVSCVMPAGATDEVLIDLSGCGINELGNAALVNVTLSALDLRQNALTSFPPGIFVNASLQILFLTDNEITEVGRGVWSGVRALRYVDLGGNNLTAVGRHDFDGLADLKTLLLNDNNISSVANGSLADVVSLDFLDVSGNALVALPSGLFLSRDVRDVAHRPLVFGIS